MKLQLNHIHCINCEITDDENETENTLLINKLHVENENETSTFSVFYQNKVSSSYLKGPNNSQNTKNHTPHVVEFNSNINNAYQITTNKIQLDFLFDSGGESNIMSIHNGMKFKSHIQKFLFVKILNANKITTAQGSSLLKYGKIQLYLVPNRTMEQNKLLYKNLSNKNSI